jgi:hypothetical protein
MKRRRQSAIAIAQRLALADCNGQLTLDPSRDYQPLARR